MSRIGSEVSQKRLPLLLIFLLGTQLALMMLTARQRSAEDGTEEFVARTWVLSVLTPIQSAVGSFFSGVGSIWTGYVDLRDVRARNEQLEAENGQLRSEIETARAEASENARLREQLDLKPLLKFESVSASVVARDASAWFKRVTIDKGTLAGVRKNQPVVTPNGLVGRVTAVGPNAAQVQLITDEHAGAGGRLTNSRAAGEIKGHGDGTCRLKSISSIQHVGKDEGVVTSGLDRVFPAGILVGFVDGEPTVGGGATPYDIVIRPSVDLDRIEEVLVLVVEEKDLVIPEGVK